MVFANLAATTAGGTRQVESLLSKYLEYVSTLAITAPQVAGTPLFARCGWKKTFVGTLNNRVGGRVGGVVVQLISRIREGQVYSQGYKQ